MSISKAFLNQTPAGFLSPRVSSIFFLMGLFTLDNFPWCLGELLCSAKCPFELLGHECNMCLIVIVGFFSSWLEARERQREREGGRERERQRGGEIENAGERKGRMQKSAEWERESQGFLHHLSLPTPPRPPLL